ncbi:hypothetical protein RHS03_08545, partial [Rhizoctonia solani]
MDLQDLASALVEESTDDSKQDPSYQHTNPESMSLPTTQSFLSRNTITSRVREQVTEAAPDGQACAITLNPSLVRCAHILRRATGQGERQQLARAWGIELNDLDLDGPENMMWLALDLHGAFNTDAWALLLPESELQSILSYAGLQWCLKTRTPFTHHYPLRRISEYTFVQLSTLHPFVRVQGNQHNIHSSPFATLPTIRSHIHPFYAICNVAKKDIKWHPELQDETSNAYSTLADPSGFLKRIRLCRLIYKIWMCCDPEPMASNQVMSNTTPSAGSDAACSQARSSRSVRSTRRDAAARVNSARLPSQTNNPSTSQHVVQTLPITDSTSTMGGPLTNVDESQAHGARCQPLDVSAQLKVGRWLHRLEDYNDHNVLAISEEIDESWHIGG